GSFDTQEQRVWTMPQHEHGKKVVFSKNYEQPPVVYYAISRIDETNRGNLRVKAYVKDVTAQGMTVHLDSWDDTDMYTTVAQWITDRDFQSGVADVKATQEYTTVNVKFDSEYASTPKVVCWLRAFDLDKDGDFRIDVTPVEVSLKGCQLKFRQWGTTKAYWIQASWIAYPANHCCIDSGSFDTQEQRDWQKPQHEHQKKVTFAKKFERPPVVYYAISRIDEANKGNPRAKSYVKDVTAQGMTAHLDSWNDTVMYTTVGQWIAI
ncbi:hypothetical protein B0J17DRAFT_528487, partial [Rhizoctonia solani]